jgi:adenylate kinase family enzyme
MKTVILILGAHAVGKSTLSRILCGIGAIEVTMVVAEETIKVTFGEVGSLALAGNLKSGSDSISKMETLRRTVEFLLQRCDVVVVDGFRCSNKFVCWLQMLPIPSLAVVFVYFELPLESNVRRLLRRRQENGASESTLPEQTRRNLLKTRVRAERVWEYARLTYIRRQNAFIVISENLSPGEAAALVLRCVDNLCYDSGATA